MNDPRLSKLPDWAQAALAEAVEATPAPSIRDQRSGAAWPLFVDAATVASFLPRDLAPGAPPVGERKEAERAVLRYSELSREAGATRWTLTREARREVLSSCEPAEIAAAVKRSAPHADPVTAALRELLLGRRQPDLRSLDVQSLEALRLAAAWLTGVSTLATPGVDELDRIIELRRLLAPFERMTGKRTRTTSADARLDRFFGRADEIETLRASVDVVAADRLGQRVKRLAKTARRLFTGHKPLNVWGTGGVGKTTLVAKFMLEHAQAAASRFPFAYLDFDRPTISASNRAGLLAEICRQVGAQFPTLSKPLSSLREQVALAERTMPSGADYISILKPLAAELRRTVDRSFEGSEPFLLVFDTFEVVQYGRDQVAALEELVSAFFDREPEWPRLRLIISGRVHVDHFLGDLDHLELGALDLEGSTQMLAASAVEAGKPISNREAESLVRAIAKVVHDPTNDGVRPLRLRLIGDLFAKEKAGGPAIVESLLDELAKPSAEQAKLGALLVDGILVRRILGHVNDPRVRALADPGLVVRRVTKDVIREVMTQGTSRDALQETTPLDPERIDPWIVDDTEAANIFEAFGREITLVEAEGDVLRHRQDVRRDMLPLIEACRPNGFGRIHRLAYDFFRRRAAKDSADDRARAEAVYHGLWLREPLDRLDSLWPGKLDPGIDPDEFPTGSLANLYLRAKRLGPLTEEEVRMLPQAISLAWWSGRTDELLGTLRVLPEVPLLRAVGGQDFRAFAGRPDLAAVAARLFYRAGMWREAMLLLRQLISPQSRVDAEGEISLLRTYATIAAKSQAPEDAVWWLARTAERIKDPVVRTEILAHAALALPREQRGAVEGSRRGFTDSVAEVPPVQWRREPRILRLAIAASLEPPPVLLETFVRATRALPVDTTVAQILTAMLDKRVMPSQINEVWESKKDGFLDKRGLDLGVGLCALAAADHSDWYVPFGNAISRGFDDFEKPILRAVQAVVDKGSYSEIARGARQRDGHLFLQLLIGDGALMRFAEALAAPQEEAPYPETAPELASALVRWHRRTAPEDLGTDIGS
jgi:hypothetical protein